MIDSLSLRCMNKRSKLKATIVKKEDLVCNMRSNYKFATQTPLY